MAELLASTLQALGDAARQSPGELCITLLALLLVGVLIRKALAASGRRTAPPAPPPPRVLRTFVASDVAAHTSRDDAWIIIKDKVYDVTPYVDEHPGGVAAILKNAGGDSTKGFHGPQHPARVFDMIGDYCIGTLVPEK